MEGTHRTDRSKCPKCGKGLDTHESLDAVDKRGPEEGDLSICSKCGSLNIFNKDYTLRAITEEEINEIHPQQLSEINNIVDKIKKMNNVSES